MLGTTLPGMSLGSFHIETELGCGGMGRVYAATVTRDDGDLPAGTRVALKVVHPHLVEGTDYLERLRREAVIGRRVSHPNVVHTYGADSCDVDGTPHHYLVMEYVEGETLRDLLAELGHLPEPLCRHVGREVAQGLAAIHAAGAFHRDIKPDNVLITPDQVVKVMDLGVARLQQESLRLSRSGAFAGTLLYAAPEQFAENPSVDHRVDIHALGLLLYESATGRHPYAADDLWTLAKRVLREEPARLAALRPELSPFLDALVGILLAKNPDGRIGPADELARILDEGERSAWWRRHGSRAHGKVRPAPHRPPVERLTAMHGRAGDLATMRELFEDVRGGTGRVLLLEGEAGIGKTRLVDEFVESLTDGAEEPDVLYGSYPPGGAATAAGAFSTAYRERFGEAHLEERLRDALAECPALVPAFAAVLRGEPVPAGAPALDRESLPTVFVRATHALAEQRPVVIVIEDLHFTPEAGRALFAAVALAVASHRVLLIGSYRPGLPADWTSGIERLDHARRMPLDRLGPKDLVALLADAFHSDRLARELAGAVAIKSDGNPFFAFEIVNGLREDGYLDRGDDGAWVRTRVIDRIDVPSSVLDLIRGRISDLSAEDREILDVAACRGFRFEPLVVAAVLGIAQIPAMRRLALIQQRHRLIRPVGRAFEFDHHQIRDALYDALPPLLREPYHAAVAEALEAQEGALEMDAALLDGPLAVDLCDQYLAGACGDRALRYLDSALEHLAGGHLTDAAVALAGRALDADGLLQGERRAELLLANAQRLEDLGHAEAERAALHEALDLAQDLGDVRLQARVTVRLGAHYCFVTRLQEADTILMRALACARSVDDRGLECRALANLARVHFRQARYDEAGEHLEAALALARNIGDREQEAGAIGTLGNLCAVRGRFEEAREHYEYWRDLAHDLGQRRGEAAAVANLGRILLARGEHARAREHYLARLAIAREDGDRQGEAIALDALGHIAIVLGELGQGVGLLEECRRLCRETGDRRIEGYALASLGRAHEARGDPEAAEEMLRASLALRQRIDYRSGIAETLVELGALLARRDRGDEARGLLERGLDLAKTVGTPGPQVHAACRLALLPGGDVAAAEELLLEHRERLDERKAMEAEYLLWKATHAREYLASAQAALTALRDRTPEEGREAIVENVPLHRAILAAWSAS